MKKIISIVVLCSLLLGGVFGLEESFIIKMIHVEDCSAIKTQMMNSRASYQVAVEALLDSSYLPSFNKYNVTIEDFVLDYEHMIKTFDIIENVGVDQEKFDALQLLFHNSKTSNIVLDYLDKSEMDELQNRVVMNIGSVYEDTSSNIYYELRLHEDLSDFFNAHGLVDPEITTLYTSYISIKIEALNRMWNQEERQVFIAFLDQLEGVSYQTVESFIKTDVVVIEDTIFKPAIELEVPSSSWDKLGLEYIKDTQILTLEDLDKDLKTDEFLGALGIESTDQTILSRYKMTSLVYDYYQSELQTIGKPFSDHQLIDSDYKMAIYYLRGANIIAGYEDNTFRGEQSLSRREAVMVLYNISKQLK